MDTNKDNDPNWPGSPCTFDPPLPEKAKSLSPEQVEERRRNLAFIRENVVLNVLGDHLFTTTLVMQEEWLATVDEAQASHRAAVRLLVSHSEALVEAQAEAESWQEARADSQDFIRQIVALVPRDPEKEDIFQAIERTVRERDEAQREANILRGLRTQKCLLSDRLGRDGPCTSFWRTIELYCAPCYLRAIHLTPEMREGIREGVQAAKEGRVTPFFEVQDELDEILEEANEQECTWLCPFCQTHCATSCPVVPEGHIFACVLSPMPTTGFVTRSGPTDRPGAEFETQYELQPPDLDIPLVVDPCMFEGHVWVRMGTSGGTGLDDMIWGPRHCLRCDAEPPEEKEWRETYPGNIIGGNRPKYLQERADD